MTFLFSSISPSSGTRQLPTAELLLDGSVAYQVSEEGRGIASIANMLTITRLHNAISACAAMRRQVMGMICTASISPVN